MSKQDQNNDEHKWQKGAKPSTVKMTTAPKAIEVSTGNKKSGHKNETEIKVIPGKETDVQVDTKTANQLMDLVNNHIEAGNGLNKGNMTQLFGEVNKVLNKEYQQEIGKEELKEKVDAAIAQIESKSTPKGLSTKDSLLYSVSGFCKSCGFNSLGGMVQKNISKDGQGKIKLAALEASSEVKNIIQSMTTGVTNLRRENEADKKVIVYPKKGTNEVAM